MQQKFIKNINFLSDAALETGLIIT